MNKIGVTIGDPAGIGPEIIAKMLLDREVMKEFPFIPIGPRFVIDDAFTNILKTDIPEYEIFDIPSEFYNIKYGSSSLEGGKISVKAIEASVELWRQKKIDGIVTCPVNTKAVRMAGYDNYRGHASFYANLTGVSAQSTLFMSEELVIIPVTEHIPVRKISESLNEDKILIAIKNAHKFSSYLAIDNPHIAVCALNPHGTDNGDLGDEEKNIIIPAIQKAKKIGFNVSGPHSADALFVYRKDFDIVIAMYHDQGLIPVKTLSFGNSVNVTLNLPFVRISVDHGTAYNIAGKNEASCSSLKHAISLAHKMVRYQNGDKCQSL